MVGTVRPLERVATEQEVGITRVNEGGSAREAVMRELAALNATLLKTQMVCAERMENGLKHFRKHSEEQNKTYVEYGWKSSAAHILEAASEALKETAPLLPILGVPVGLANLSKTCNWLAIGCKLYGGVYIEGLKRSALNTKEITVKLTQQREMDEPRSIKDQYVQACYSVTQAQERILNATQPH